MENNRKQPQKVERLAYFSFHPADYLLDTTDLTLSQHGAYLMLMLRYYWQGGLARDDIYRACRTDQDRADVDLVIARYFHVDGDAITHNRIDRELEKIARFVEHQSKAGKASGIARAAKSSAPKHTKGNGVAEGFGEFWAAYPKKVDKGHAEKAWRKVKSSDVPAILSAVKEQSLLWRDPQYIPYPAKWINGKQWQNERPSYGECQFCGQPATGTIDGIPHCDVPRHIDQAKDHARNSR